MFPLGRKLSLFGEGQLKRNGRKQRHFEVAIGSSLTAYHGRSSWKVVLPYDMRVAQTEEGYE